MHRCGCLQLQPVATEDNGTCDFAEQGGCILPFACNFDPEADFFLPGSCDFESCFSYIQNDTCNNPFACNFEEEGDCDFHELFGSRVH